MKRSLSVVLLALCAWYWGFPALLDWRESVNETKASAVAAAERSEYKKTRCGNSILFRSMITNNEVPNCYLTKEI